MRILYHHRTRAEDAQGIHIREIVRGMRELGHTVKVAALAGEGKPAQPGNSGKRHPLTYEIMTLGYNLYGFVMLAKEALSFSPDMMYERYSLNTFCGVLVSRIFRIPLILEVNAPLSHEQKKYEKIAIPSLAVFLERWICTHATRTIVVSQVMKEMLVEIGVPQNRMVVMPNGIDPEEYHPGVPGDAVRKKHGLDGKVVLGFVGWFKKWHGLDMLIGLYARERWDREGVHILLVGDGPARGELEALVERHGLREHVTFTGPVPRERMAQYVAAIDIALQPNVTEYASPMKIFEYMGMGKCIVAPEQANILEILEDGKTALLFQPGDEEDLRKVLWRVIGLREVREQLGREARKAVFDRGYLWKKNAERAIALAFPGGRQEGGR